MSVSGLSIGWQTWCEKSYWISQAYFLNTQWLKSRSKLKLEKAHWISEDLTSQLFHTFHWFQEPALTVPYYWFLAINSWKGDNHCVGIEEGRLDLFLHSIPLTQSPPPSAKLWFICTRKDKCNGHSCPFLPLAAKRNEEETIWVGEIAANLQIQSTFPHCL